MDDKNPSMAAPQRWNELIHILEGPVALQLPAPLCQESIEDLDDFFRLLLKRLRRRLSEQEPEETSVDPITQSAGS